MKLCCYCPLGITRKELFCFAFILNENILFWLTISYQKPFIFSVSVFCSQIFTLKLNLQPKIGLTYAISIVKWFFFYFLCKKAGFLFSLLNLNSWMFHNNIVKISEKWTYANMLKTCLQFTYPKDFCIIIPMLFEEKAVILWYPKSGPPAVHPSVISHHCS